MSLGTKMFVKFTFSNPAALILSGKVRIVKFLPSKIFSTTLFVRDLQPTKASSVRSLHLENIILKLAASFQLPNLKLNNLFLTFRKEIA